ncbi:MAG TPA: transglycosylase domain-containing protein, partial [Stellaceae bacterium]|nr:transglycosylase domain-containing protein [Stellaceae bacterium]
MAEKRTSGMRADPGDRAGTSGRRSPKRKAKGKKPRGRGLLARILLLTALWGLIFFSAVIAYFAFTLPPIGDLTVAERRPSLTLLADDGSLIATYGDLFGEPLKLKDMPRYLPEAVIATEDRRFYHHWGVDPIGLGRALFVNLRAGHLVQGGSTITQQLAKNLFLNPERTFTRKIQEVLLAFWLEHKFTKDQILEIYLNRVYLGAGSYGIDAAAHRYFNKSARAVSLYEAAVLAGLLKAPSRFSPAHDADLAAARASQVLANLVEAGYVTQAEAKSAGAQRTRLAAAAARTRPGSRYFADWVAEQAVEYASGQNQDLVVHTTFSPKIQRAAETAIEEALAREGTRANIEQGALVALSPDGAVRAMVGGRDYAESQFNRTTQALRQPGSAFKPLVYLAALEHGVHASDHFIDRPLR